jgi:hypothetical protein
MAWLQNQKPAEDARVKTTKQHIEALYLADKITSSEATELFADVIWLQIYIERRRAPVAVRWWDAFVCWCDYTWIDVKNFLRPGPT